MNNEHIDASVGLLFSLQVLQQYRRSGILQATMRRIPGMHGVCHAFLHLEKGVVTACYILDSQGREQTLFAEALSRLNDERGPFEWTFQPQQITLPPVTTPVKFISPNIDTQVPPFNPLQLAQAQQRTTWNAAIPRIIASLSWQQFNAWRPLHKHMLVTVLQAVDGRKTIGEIKTAVSLSPAIVDEIVRILIDLQVLSLY